LELQLAIATSNPAQQGHVQHNEQAGLTTQGLNRRGTTAGTSAGAANAATQGNTAQLEALLNEQLEKNLKLEEQLAKSKVGWEASMADDAGAYDGLADPLSSIDESISVIHVCDMICTVGTAG
jgi:hypothetical protein